MKVFFLKMWHIINTATLKTLISIHVANDVSFCPSSQTQYIFFIISYPFFAFFFIFIFLYTRSPPLPLPSFLAHCGFQMLQLNLKQRKPPLQTERQRPPSPRMTKAKSNLTKAEIRVWRITQKQKSKRLLFAFLSKRAVRFYLFVIFCVAMIFSCWGSFQREVFWLKLIVWESAGDDDVVNDCVKCL